MPGKKSSKPKKSIAGRSHLVRWNVSQPKVKVDATAYGKPAKHYTVRLYVAGSGINSMHAITSLEKFCGDYLKGKIDFEVVDLYQQPLLAKQDDIVAVPCLVKIRPLPRTMYVGRMDDCGAVLARLGIDPSRLKH